MRSIKKIIKSAFKKKPTELFTIIISFCLNKILYFIWRFDKWHISPFYIRKYAQCIVKYLNKIDNRNAIIEIGCGLGGIIRRLRYKKRDGFDYEVKVLKAARFISFFTANQIHFKQFEFPKDILKNKYDGIIMVNWIHHIRPDLLKNVIAFYIENNLNSKGRIIIDTVHDSKYEYQHDINFISGGLKCRIEKICDDKPSREVFAIIKED